MVWAYHFRAGEPAKIVASSDIEATYEQVKKTSDEFLWLNFSLANSSTLKWLKTNLTLPDSFYDSLQGHAGSTRLEQESDSLVVVINDVMYDFNFDSAEISSASLFINTDLVVSVRLRPLRSLEQLRSNVREGASFRSSAELLAHLLEDQVAVLSNIVRQKSNRIDEIEDKLLAQRITFKRSELGAIRRVLVRLQRLLAPEPAAFFRLLNKPPGWIKAEELTELRQSAEEFSLAVGDAANLIERVKLLQEELAALVNEQTNRTLSILTLVTVLALPINLTAGLFGMNVGGVPWASSAHGFLVVAGTICLLTIILAIIVLKRSQEQ